MASTALSPSVSAKLKTKQIASQIRHGSPKLQDVLRERCRQRMREKRGQLFNRSRFSLEIEPKNIQDTLTEIVRKEFRNLATEEWDQSLNSSGSIIDEPLSPEEALDLENEILYEQEQWILEEYEKMSANEVNLRSTDEESANQVVCPMCQRSNLTEEVHGVTCKACGFTLNTCTSLRKLGSLINECANTHSTICAKPPGFALLPENNNVCLYIVCDVCSTMAPII